MTHFKLQQIAAFALLTTVVLIVLSGSAAADETPVKFQYCAGEVDSAGLEYFKMIERYKSIGGAKSEKVINYSGSALWAFSADLAIYGDYLYVLNVNGLQIFDITDRTSPVLLKEIHLEFGSMYTHLCLDGTYLYVPANDRLMIIDISDPLNPSEIGRIILNSFINRVKVIGNRAYAGVGQYYLDYTETPAFYIIDITDKSSPSIIGKYHSPAAYEDAREFVINGDYVYTSNHWSDRVEIISIADETSPTYVGYLSIQNPIGMVFRNGYLYVGGSDLYVIDATDPGSLSLIQTYTMPTVYALGIHNDILYAMEYLDPLTHAYGFVGDWELNLLGTHTSRGTRFSLEFDGDNMFIGEGSWGWSVADISNPANMPRIGEFSNSASDMMGLAIRNDFAYVTNYMSYFEGDSSMSRNGVYVIDATDKENPVFVEHEYIAGNTSNAYIYDTLLIVSQCPRTFLYSLADPADPVYMGRYPPEDYILSHSNIAKDTLLYVCGSGYGFDIASIADPTWPSHLATVKGPEEFRASISAILKSHYAYVVDKIVNMEGSNDVIRLMTVDISQPANPVISDDLFLREFGWNEQVGYPQIVSREDYLYISAVTHGVYIIDISNPELPDLVIRYSPQDAEYYHAAFRRNYMFLAANSSIEVLDISNPADPQMVQFVPLSSSPQRLAVEGDYLYVAARQGFYLYEISLPPTACGDVDWSGGIDIDDVVQLISYIFAGGLPPDPIESGDVDCSQNVDIDDVVYLITYIFAGGPVPCADCP